MLDSLDMQMKQREEDVRQEKQDSIKQVGSLSFHGQTTII
jgi:hypothetical protein